MHAAPIAVPTVVIVLPLFMAGLASCDLGIDVGSLSAGCAERCDGGGDGADGGDVSPQADGDSPEADAAPPCPDAADAAAGAMVRVGVGDASICVDRVEVTNAAFAAFLDGGAPGAVPAGCDPGASNAPADWPPSPGRETYPVTNVTWCAAHAYCAWAGKRLCGAIGGGALDPALFGRAAFDAWFAVCSADGSSKYPYGDAYAPGRCNGNDYGAAAPLPVGSLATCAAGDDGPRDMSGNVWEWIDACDAQGNCFARGGAFNSPAAELACTSAIGLPRTVTNGTIGLRCCSP